jgi:hypothetical protein
MPALSMQHIHLGGRHAHQGAAQNARFRVTRLKIHLD